MNTDEPSNHPDPPANPNPPTSGPGDSPDHPPPPGTPRDGTTPRAHARPLIITRRIQILLQAADSEKWKADYKKLCEWQRIVARAARSRWPSSAH